ncbi:hypothetical protein [uncultured Tateyamaria sp.]|uniref:hypothetical protein n=1 Tax=uncultured Tateyamaria sp. TaxID=455651 RepID=UPI00260870CB|nr:hypothetical protein [uncultured Tateyamaria sp.]
MKIERYFAIRHKHMGPGEAFVRDNPLAEKSINWRVFKKYTSQNMAGSETEEDAVRLVPAPFGVIFYAGNWPIHSCDLSPCLQGMQSRFRCLLPWSVATKNLIAACRWRQKSRASQSCKLEAGLSGNMQLMSCNAYQNS